MRYADHKKTLDKYGASKETISIWAPSYTPHQTFFYAPIFMAVARFAIKLVLCGIKKQFQVLLRIFYLPWSSGFGFTTMGNKWLLGKCPLSVTLASYLGHFALEIEPKVHEINKLELKS